ncbi:hypothetical protein [Dyella silvatica]|uniref:hypothetical protein n=1 Tax=Dyella silvatica TaxID=2992128 RepID=UPI00224FDB39|nr:hypothetical protein [Dyella silvatica]
MSSLWTELLFLHGHIADWQLAKQLTTPPVSTEATGPAATPLADKPSRPSPRELALKLSKRLCLGIGGGLVCTQ